MSLKVLLDMDGVVADFVTGAMKLHSMPWPYGCPEARGEDGWHIDRLWGMTQDAFYTGMDYGFWVKLPVYKWAHDLVDHACSKVGQDNVCFVTSPTCNPGCVEGKIDWAEQHFPEIPIILTRSGTKRLPIKCFLAHADAILVDDYDENVFSFRQEGGHAVLFPRPWNTAERYSDCAVDVAKASIDLVVHLSGSKSNLEEFNTKLKTLLARVPL